MKFVFPQNYNFNNKLFGFIDYSTLILNILWGLLIFLFIYFIIPNITLQIIFFIILFLFFCFFILFLFNYEKILYIIIYLFKYIISPKIYLFKKY